MFINLLKIVPILIGMLITTAITPNDRPADHKTEESWEKPEDIKARVDRYFEQHDCSG